MAKEKNNKVEESKRKGGGGKLSRNLTVTVRMDPKLKFAAELAARKQRRTLSSFIEWAIDEATKSTHMISQNDPTTADDIAQRIWHPNEWNRLVHLGLNYYQFLTFEEERMWLLILQYSKAWVEADVYLSSLIGEEELKKDFKKVTDEDFERLEKLWPHFVAACHGSREDEYFLIEECNKKYT
jgi:hypothetical protein